MKSLEEHSSRQEGRSAQQDKFTHKMHEDLRAELQQQSDELDEQKTHYKEQMHAQQEKH